jgi:predicted secreted protein
LADQRSGRVVFVSHCLLNQNTRYLGGAVCPGVVRDAVEPYANAGIGIVQMPCPEQRLWGGVLKRRLLLLVEAPTRARASAALLPVFAPYLRWRYWRLARAIADDIEDYTTSGLGIVGVIGVADSPSCGATTTLDLKASLQEIGWRAAQPVTADWMNDRVVASALQPGRGLFLQALTDELDRRKIAVPITEHTLTAR